MKIVLIIISTVLLLSACVKDIDIDMPAYEEKIVVEGWIINDEPARVLLTTNFEYTRKAGTDLYEASFIHDAIISVTTEDGNSEQLTEVALYDEEYDYTGYMYIGQNLLGEAGKSYILTVEVAGRQVSSLTEVPGVVDILDIWQEPHPEAGNDSMKIIKCKIQDPEGKNYYRYLYMINGEDGASPELSTLEDSGFEGEEYIKAIDSGLANEEQDIHGGVAGYFYTGDTITVNWINAEKSYYDFWTTVDFSRSTEMSPFSRPAQVPGNVDGALGYWSGAGVSRATIILE